MSIGAMEKLDLSASRTSVNLAPAELIEDAIRRGEGTLASNGALVCKTGTFTGRCPKDKYLEDTPGIHDKIWWGKVNQAMSHGLPVVATSCAAEGMYTEHGRDILVADDAAAFAAEVCRLYRDGDLWARLAANGRINVERYFSLDAARRSLESLLAELEPGG